MRWSLEEKVNVCVHECDELRMDGLSEEKVTLVLSISTPNQKSAPDQCV